MSKLLLTSTLCSLVTLNACSFRVSSQLVDTQGKPIAYAQVFVATPERMISMQDGKSAIPETVIVSTDKRGRFWIPSQHEGFSVVVIDRRGYAQASQKELILSDRLVLQPWGQIKGQMVFDGQPIANQNVRLQVDQKLGRAKIYLRYDTKTNSSGQFQFNQVPHGEVAVGRLVEFRRARSGVETMDHNKTIKIRPAGISQVIIGSSGWPVVGKLTVPGHPGFNFENYFVYGFLEREFKHAGKLMGLTGFSKYETYAIAVDPDGSFRLADIPSGRYKLSVEVRELNQGPSWGQGKLIAAVTQEVVAPDSTNESKPFDLGLLELSLAE